jgi:hypothetical protein
MIQLEFFQHFLAKQMDMPDIGFFNPYGNPTVLNPNPPTHYTTEGGGTYSSRPDLTRAGGPGVYRAAAAAGVIGAVLIGAGVITSGYSRVIENQTASEQRSSWQLFSSGLTGTFGIGSGLNL